MNPPKGNLPNQDNNNKPTPKKAWALPPPNHKLPNHRGCYDLIKLEDDYIDSHPDSINTRGEVTSDDCKAIHILPGSIS